MPLKTGATIPAAFAKAPKVKTRTKAAKSGRLAYRLTDDLGKSQIKSLPGRTARMPIVWTRLDAVQAEGAIHVARFTRLKKLKLASALRSIALDAIKCPARSADLGTADFHLEGRSERLHEMKLSDRAHELAKTGAAKESVNKEGAEKISKDHQSGNRRFVPEVESLVRPQVSDNEADREPL